MKSVIQIVLLLSIVVSTSHTQTIALSSESLLDKIRGGWFGKAYGVTYGGPTEFTSLGNIIEDSIHITQKSLSKLSTQDDLFINMAFLGVVSREGADAPISSFANEYANSGFLLWHANGQARQNLLAGIPPTVSGHPYYTVHADDISFQIGSDFIGLIHPGLPQTAFELTDKVGHMITYGDGFYGGVFVSTMYTAAFFHNDVASIIRSGLQMLPENSRYANVICDVIKWHKENPSDWRTTWRNLENKWNRDLCPWGALHPLNISAHMNGGYVVLALLYGDGDFEKTTEIATRCGQDSDCNPSTAAGIIGTMLGYNQIPKYLRETFQNYMNIPFLYTEYSLESAAKECHRIASQNIVNHAGKVNNGVFTIQLQKYAFQKALENSFPSLEPVDRFEVTDTRLQWKGDWKLKQDPEEPMMTSSTQGDSFEIEFVGTGIYVQGDIRYDKGIIQYSLDGNHVGERDMYHPKKWKNAKQSTAVWLTGLQNGTHKLQVTVSGKKRQQSEGTEISLGRIVIYRGEIAELPKH